MATSYPQTLIDLETIEALAILRGLQLCLHLEISNLKIKSDCLLLVEEILHQDNPSSVVRNLVLDIKELTSSIPSCSIQHDVWCSSLVS